MLSAQGAEGVQSACPHPGVHIPRSKILLRRPVLLFMWNVMSNSSTWLKVWYATRRATACAGGLTHTCTNWCCNKASCMQAGALVAVRAGQPCQVSKVAAAELICRQHRP